MQGIGIKFVLISFFFLVLIFFFFQNFFHPHPWSIVVDYPGTTAGQGGKDGFLYGRPIRHPCPRRKSNKPVLLSANLSHEEFAVSKTTAE